MHPHFLSSHMRLEFLKDIRYHLREGDPTSQLVTDLENLHSMVLASSSGSWFQVAPGNEASFVVLLQEREKDESELEHNLRTKFPLLLTKVYNMVVNHESLIGKIKKYYTLPSLYFPGSVVETVYPIPQRTLCFPVPPNTWNREPLEDAKTTECRFSKSVTS
nr:hypothetical protein [Tanacetum cinerariifolium]